MLKLLLVPAVKSRAAVAVQFLCVPGRATTSPLYPGGPSDSKTLYPGHGIAYLRALKLSGKQISEDADVPSSVYKTKFRWDVSARHDGEYFRVFYRHQYPNAIEETRDTHRFKTLAEAEKFAETMRQTERFYRNLG